MSEELDWGDVDGGYEPPPEDVDGAVRTSVTADERETVHPDIFWKARPILEHIHAFARSRRVGPWAVLGATLTRVIAATPPRVQIPPTIGGNASLNIFVGLVGNSGDGKDIAQKVAREALVITGEPFKTNPVGSGEGLSHMFMRPGKVTREEKHPDPELYNVAALVTVGEIDTMGAMVQRNSSTIASQLRQAAMGEPLGFFYVDPTKRMMVPEHAYRLCMIAGIQPARSAVLLNDADGGTPQRLVWLPAGDPEAPDIAPDELDPMVWESPDWTQATRGQTSDGAEYFLVDLPEVAVRTTVENRLKRLREVGEALDGHAILTRTKVACALAVLEGRHQVSESDWDLSGTVMAVSDAQRARCQRELTTKAAATNEAQAHAEAQRTLVIEDRLAREKLPRVTRAIKRKLLREAPESVPRGKLRAGLMASDREFFDQALDALVSVGEVVVDGARVSLA